MCIRDRKIWELDMEAFLQVRGREFWNVWVVLERYVRRVHTYTRKEERIETQEQLHSYIHTILMVHSPRPTRTLSCTRLSIIGAKPDTRCQVRMVASIWHHSLVVRLSLLLLSLSLNLRFEILSISEWVLCDLIYTWTLCWQYSTLELFLILYSATMTVHYR